MGKGVGIVHKWWTFIKIGSVFLEVMVWKKSIEAEKAIKLAIKPFFVKCIMIKF